MDGVGVHSSGTYKNSSHQSLRHWWQSDACLEFAPAQSLIQSTNNSLFFVSTKNCPRTTYALSNPLLVSLWPRVFPIPASSVTGLADIGSAMKFLCFCDVVDIFFFLFSFLKKVQTSNCCQLCQKTENLIL